MRHTIFIPIALILIAVTAVAIVRAQQWSPWAGQNIGGGQPAVTTDNSQQALANRPNRIQAPEATPLPSRFAAGGNPQYGQPMPQRSHFTQTPAQAPVMIENHFATDPNYGRSIQPVIQTQATQTSPSDAGQPAQPVQPAIGQQETSRRSPSGQAMTANVSDGTPGHLAQATSTIPDLNKETEDGNDRMSGPTSRRPWSMRQPLTEAEGQPELATDDRTGEEPPRLAQREDQPSLPPLNIEGDGPAPVVQGENANPQVNANAGDLLFQAEAPVLSVTLAGPAKIGVRKSAEYVINVKNDSRVEAEDVVVSLDLPGWAEVTSSEATLGAARHEAQIGEGNRIKWSVFRLEAGTTETLKLKIVARESRSFELAVNWTHAPKTHIARIEVQEPKLEMALTGPRDVLYGESKTYTITVANPGSGPAENVVINLLPIAPGQDKAGVSNLGTIEPGGRREIEIDLTARQAGDLELRVQAFADGGLRSEAAEQIHVRRGALEVVVGGPEVKYAGTLAAYQVRVSNTGDALAENVTAEAVLPRNASFVSASDGGQLQEAQNRVKWAVGALRSGATRVFEVRCVLAEAGSNRVEVVSTADEDLTSAAHCVTSVEALADLKLLINDPQGPLPAGEPMVYEVRIINRGTKAADGVQIASFFSEGIEPLSVEGGRAEIGIGQVVFTPIPRIAAGQEIVFRITAKAETGGNHTFRTQVVCTKPETTLAAQETTRFYGGIAARQYQDDRPLNQRPAEATLTPPRFEERR